MSDACASDLKIVIDVGYEDLMTDYVRAQTVVRKSMYMIVPWKMNLCTCARVCVRWGGSAF